MLEHFHSLVLTFTLSSCKTNNHTHSIYLCGRFVHIISYCHSYFYMSLSLPLITLLIYDGVTVASHPINGMCTYTWQYPETWRKSARGYSSIAMQQEIRHEVPVQQLHKQKAKSESMNKHYYLQPCTTEDTRHWRSKVGEDCPSFQLHASSVVHGYKQQCLSKRRQVIFRTQVGNR